MSFASKKEVVCRYWKEGKCLKGNNCPYLHPKTEGGFGSPTQNRFEVLSAPGSSTLQKQLSSSEIRALIVQDMKDALTPSIGLWALSCYGAEKHAENAITGDISPDELRFEAYKQQQLGNLEIYKETVRQMIETANSKKQALMHNPDAGLQSSQNLVSSSPFGNITSPSFGTIISSPNISLKTNSTSNNFSEVPNVDHSGTFSQIANPGNQGSSFFFWIQTTNS